VYLLAVEIAYLPVQGDKIIRVLRRGLLVSHDKDQSKQCCQYDPISPRRCAIAAASAIQQSPIAVVLTTWHRPGRAGDRSSN
jgi:hypothetical protein